MNDIELKNIWKNYDEKLEKVIACNESLVKEVTKLKVESSLAKAKPIKIFALAIGIPWVIILYSLFILGCLSGAVFFAISFGAIAIINTIVIVTYII